MATLTFNGESFIVDHATKGTDYIHGYDADGVVIVSFDGITDFSVFSYDGTYMNPSDCLAEQCNNMVYCGGMMKTKGGAVVPASAIGAAPAIESDTYPGCYYRMVGNEREWINPPMVYGTEYRTAERFCGIPVYVCVVDVGYLDKPNPTATIPHGLAVGRTLGIELFNGNQHLTTDGGVNHLTFDTTNIYLQCDWPMGGAVFLLKYTK